MRTEEWTPEAHGVIADGYKENLCLIRKASHAEISEDVVIREIMALNRCAALIYVDGLIDRDSMQRFLLEPLLIAAPPKDGDCLETHLSQSVLPLAFLSPTSSLETLLQRVFSGDAALILDGMTGALIADMKGFVKSGLHEPLTETVTAGPHEGFSESLRDNTVLIRRLMRTPALISEQINIGEKIPARLCLMYLNGIAKKENVDEIKRRIDGCRIDYVSSIGVLEQLLEDDPLSLLPQIAATERPDRAVGFLNEGQIVIVMENAPQILALPISLAHLVHAPDDTALRWQYGSFLRGLRIVGMAVSLLLPAVFVAVTMFHPEGMSLSLLTSVVESQARVPLSLFASMVLMLLIFCLINEASARIPGIMGASLSIVGGLILGQAVVEADLFSPLILIVVALSGLGSYAAPTYPVTLALRLSQFILLFSAGIGGYPLLLIALFYLMLRVFSQTSLNQPFLAPYAPKRPRNPDGFLRLPIWRQRLRGAAANPFFMNRVRGAMRAWDRTREKP